MCKLKNHDRYLQRLEQYAEASGLAIKYADEPCEGAFIPSRNYIRIDPSLADAAEIATILHELGHSIDDTLVNPETCQKLEAAYRQVYGKKCTKRQSALVIECEERAWKFGRALAKKLRIPLGKWYDKQEKEALEAYRRSP